MDFTDKRYFMYRNVSDYIPFDEDEKSSKAKILELIKNSENCFEKDNLPGHITGSALVVNKDFTHTLLTHHHKLNKWFQFGGHSDGDYNTFYVALREAHEESGLKNLQFHSPLTGIFDIDIHLIPENEKMLQHNHCDVRILLIADMYEDFIISDESHDIKWFNLDEAKLANPQKAFSRMIEKVKILK